MTRRTPGWVAPLVAVAELAFGTTAPDDEIPFDDLAIFLELDPASDRLGVRLRLDGEPWRSLTIKDPCGKTILEADARGRLKRLGLTELVFEGGEATPAEVLALLPEGVYTFRGKTVEGDRLAGSATLSHALGPAPVIASPGAAAAVDRGNAVVAWSPVPGVVGWEVTVASADAGPAMTVPLAAAATSLRLAVEFLEPDTSYRVAVAAILANGNRTVSKVVFRTRRAGNGSQESPPAVTRV